MKPYYTKQAKVGDVLDLAQSKSAEHSYGLPDLKRFKGLEFVVVNTAMEGGGTGHGPHDIFPDGWHVTVKKLAPDGTYNDRARDFDFYQSGCFNNMIDEVYVVGKMKMTFTLTREVERVK